MELHKLFSGKCEGIRLWLGVLTVRAYLKDLIVVDVVGACARRFHGGNGGYAE